MNFGDPIFLNAIGFLFGLVLVGAPWFFPYVCGMIVYHFIRGWPVRAIAWIFSVLLYCFFSAWVIIASLGSPGAWDMNPILGGFCIIIYTLIYPGQMVYWKLSQRRNKDSTRARRAKDAVSFWISVTLTVIVVGLYQDTFPFLQLFIVVGLFFLSTLWAVAVWFFPYVCGMIVYHFIRGRPLSAIMWIISVLLYCVLLAGYVFCSIMDRGSMMGISGMEMKPIILGISTLIFLGQTIYWGLSQPRNKDSTRARRAKNAVGFWISLTLTVIAVGGLLQLPDDLFLSKTDWNRLLAEGERRVESDEEHVLPMLQLLVDVGFQRYPGDEYPDHIWLPYYDRNVNMDFNRSSAILKFEAKGDANGVLNFYKDCAEKAGLEAKIYEKGYYGPTLFAIGSNKKAMVLYQRRGREDIWYIKAYKYLKPTERFEYQMKRRFELNSPR